MSAATDTPAKIRRQDLYAYPKSVVDVLMEAINEYGVPYRFIDGSHIRLYNGDRSVIPYKASASRPAKYTLQYLHRWLEENWEPWTKREQVSETSLAAPDSRYPGQGDAPAAEKTPEADAPAAESTGDDDWKPYVNGSGKSHGFLTNGTSYRCETCGHEQPHRRGLHLHAVMHDEDRKQEYVRKSVEAKRSKRGERRALEEQQGAHLSAALAALAEHHGYALVPLAEAGISKEEVERLREQVEKLTKENEDLEARLALVKEAFGA